MSVIRDINLYVFDAVNKKYIEAINTNPDVIKCEHIQNTLEEELEILLEAANEKAKKLFKKLGYTKNKNVFTRHYNSSIFRNDNPIVMAANEVKNKFKEQAYSQYKKIIFDLNSMDNYTKEDVDEMINNVKFEI